MIANGSYNDRQNRGGSMFDRSSLRLSAALLLGGQLLYIVVTQFHADGTANDHPSVFAEYANSGDWKVVHVLQFLSAAILLAGLFALYFAFDLQSTRARWSSRFGAALAVVALALYAVLQAVDGIGNKEVDAAWVNASSADKAARFASAEAMRWLEWGARSYFNYALGLALILFSVAVLLVRGIARPVAYLMGLSGIAYLVQGWIVGAEGFSDANSTLIVVAWVISVVWMIWLAVIARRTPASQGSGNRKQR